MNNFANPKLVILSEVKRGTSFDLKKKIYTCGRNDDSDIVLNDTSISTNHCEFMKSDDNYIVRDLGSTNGTKVNNLLIKEYVLKDNDIIQIGSIELLFDSKKDKATSNSKKTGIILTENEEKKSIQEMSNFSPFAKAGNKKNKLSQSTTKIIIISAGVVIAGLLTWFFVLT